MIKLPTPPGQAKQKGLGCLLAVAVGVALFGLLSYCSRSEKPETFKDYTVEMDTRDLYEGEKVRLKVTTEPVCGKGTFTGKGVKGAGILETQMDVDPLEVIVEPCMENPAVKLPDGRVLYLK